MPKNRPSLSRVKINFVKSQTPKNNKKTYFKVPMMSCLEAFSSCGPPNAFLICGCIGELWCQKPKGNKSTYDLFA